MTICFLHTTPYACDTNSTKKSRLGIILLDFVFGKKNNTTDPIGPTRIGTAGKSTFYFFSIALPFGIAYIFQAWRYLYIASSSIPLLCLHHPCPYLCIRVPNMVPLTEAIKLMSIIASSNGNHLPDDVVLALDEETNNDNSCHDDRSSNNERLQNKGARVGSIVDVVRSLTRVRLLIAVALNFFVCLLKRDELENQPLLERGVEFGGGAASVCDNGGAFGRRPLTVVMMWFSGFFCLMGSLVSNVGVWKVVRMVCGVLGIFGMVGTYNLLFIYTTVVRNTAQMGAILAPFVVVLGGWLLFAVFEACGIVGGVFAFFLPETLNQPLDWKLNLRDLVTSAA
ncbi:Organic cation/carnitine transporter 4, partial [Mucuna pruriens]